MVGSDNFLESVLLADIYGQALAAKGYTVQYKLNIASREVTYNLLKAGTITLKPEYNGALLTGRPDQEEHPADLDRAGRRGDHRGAGAGPADPAARAGAGQRHPDAEARTPRRSTT